MKEEAALPLTRTVPLVSEETEKVTPAASSSESEKLRSVVVIVYVSPSVTVAARSPVMLGGSFAGVQR